jgi:aspartyl protease family protein
MDNKPKIILAIVLVGIAILGLLIWRFPYALSSDDNWARLIWCSLLLSVFIPSAVHRYGSRQAFIYSTTWIGIFFLFLIGYSYRDSFNDFAQRIKTNILPFQGTENQDGSVSFMRADDGHFLLEAHVNGVPTQFMLDTGASKIALTIPDARRLGINVNNLSYNEPMHTANGLTFGASIQLLEIKVGNIIVRNVSASVCQNLSQPSLLGMSFLKKLKGFKIEGDHLTFEGSSNP